MAYIGSNDSMLYCINANTGAFIWNYKTEYFVFSSPAVTDNRVYVGSDQMYCLDAVTGDYIWSYPTGTIGYSSPAIYDNKVYVGSMDWGIYCLDGLSGDFIWSYQTGNQVNASPTVSNANVYIGSADNNIYCLDALTGALVWDYPTGGPVVSSAAVDSGKVYVGSDDYNVYCLDASTGAYIWSYPTGDRVWGSSPAVADGKVYVGSLYDGIYCLDASTGSLIWSYAMTQMGYSSPVVAEGNVYVVSGGDRKIYAFGQPVCAVYPTSFDFGITFIGDYLDTTFTIKNTGGGILEGNVSDSCDHYDIVSGGGLYNLTANDSVVVTVRFEPTAAGTLTCIIETGSDLCDSVFCTGIGEPLPACDVYPPGLDFGSINIGESVNRDFTIRNNGGQTLTGNVSESCYHYSIISGGGAYSLTAGQFTTVTVQFLPTSGGLKTCTIETGSALCSDVPCIGFGNYLAVELVSFAATELEGNVEVAWTTATEINNAGYNIYRSLENGGGRLQLNNELILAEGNELSGATYSFIDVDIAKGVAYEYWLEDVSVSGNGIMHGPVSVCLGKNTQIPLTFSLAQNYPNPFNPLTEIRYDIHTSCHVRLEVYTALGNMVMALVDEYQEAGSKRIVWDGKNSGGLEVSSGIYFYRLQASNFTAVRKMILLK